MYVYIIICMYLNVHRYICIHTYTYASLECKINTGITKIHRIKMTMNSEETRTWLATIDTDKNLTSS